MIKKIAYSVCKRKISSGKAGEEQGSDTGSFIVVGVIIKLK